MKSYSVFWRILFVFGFVVTPQFSFSAEASKVCNWSKGTFYYINDAKHRKALVAGNVANNHVYHQSANGRQNAQWQFIPAGNCTYYIVDRKHGRVVLGGDGYNGQLYHQPHRNRTNARWTISRYRGGYLLTDVKHRRSLIAGNNYDGRVYHQSHQNRTNAIWYIRQVPYKRVCDWPQNTYYIISDARHNRSLVAGNNADNHVYHQEPLGRRNAQWRFIPAGNCTYYIVDRKHKDKALVAGDSYDKALYHQRHRNRANAKWTISSIQGAYLITDAKHKYELIAGDRYNGRLYHQPHQNRLNARWKIEKIQPITRYWTRRQLEQAIYRYAPVVHMSSQEKYFPSTVASYLKMTRVRIHHGGRHKTGLEMLNHSTAFTEGNLASAKIYIHIKYYPTVTDIQYWIFSPFNGSGTAYFKYLKGVKYKSAGDYLMVPCGQHEGDWEHVTIRVHNKTKTQHSIRTEAHGHGHWYPIRGNKRQTVYMSKFGKGIYISKGRNYSGTLKMGVVEMRLVNFTDAGPILNTRRNMIMSLHDFTPDNFKDNRGVLRRFGVKEPTWFKYTGRWGAIVKRKNTGKLTRDLTRKYGTVLGKSFASLIYSSLKKVGLGTCTESSGPEPPWQKMTPWFGNE